MINIWENNDVFRGLFFAVIGFIVLTIFFIWWRSKCNLRIKATGTAKATITNLSRRGKRNSYYIPVYEYYAEGRMRKVTSHYSSYSVIAEDGAEVDVFFIPGQPEKLYVPMEKSNNGVLIGAACFISVMFILMGTFVMLGLM